MSLEEPIFIVGYPRSGTTLLQCMMSAHSQLFSLQETHFFSEVMRKLCKSVDDILISEDIRMVFQGLQDTMNIEETVFSEFMTAYAEKPVTGRQIFEFVIDHFRPGNDSGRSLRVVEKTPMHALFIPEISQMYPDARFIHIVRDPRDAISSAMNLPVNRYKWLPFYIRSWRHVIRKIESFTETMPNAILILRYEDLVLDPNQQLREICKFLNLHYEDEMVSDFSNQYKRNVDEKTEYWKKDVENGTINPNKEKWRERITDAQAWLIEVEAGKEMAQYKYPRLSSPLLRNKVSVLWQSVKTAWEEGQQPLKWITHFIKDLLRNSS